jgi:hypothetical protein
MIKPETILKKVNETQVEIYRRTTAWQARACIRSRVAAIRQLAASKRLGKAYLVVKSGAHVSKLKDVMAELERQGVKMTAEDSSHYYWRYTAYSGTMKTLGKVVVQLHYDSRGPVAEVRRREHDAWHSSIVLRVHYSSKRMLVKNTSLDKILEPEA